MYVIEPVFDLFKIYFLFCLFIAESEHGFSLLNEERKRQEK